jgi:hypothetical protein
MWVLPAAIVLLALGTATLLLRAVAREATELQQALLDLERVAVAVDDLSHEARSVEPAWRRVSRQ